MARPGAEPSNFPKEPHTLSLKVLRLSRPSLAQQYPLPKKHLEIFTHGTALTSSSEEPDQDFILSSTLTLPPAFGSAYVGEAFACSLCANNELPSDGSSSPSRQVSGIRMTAEMQTPSRNVPLTLLAASVEDEDGLGQSIPGSSLQRIIRFDLKEEGNHVLVVNVSYSESTLVLGDAAAPRDRVRSFRKLYQFMAQPCLSVRTKTTELAALEVPDKSLGPYGRSSLVRYVLEAQLENVSQGTVVLEQANLSPHPPFHTAPLSWNCQSGGEVENNPILSPRDVHQVAFLVEQERGVSTGVDELKANLRRDGRTILGQIAIEWRGAMGEKGQLTTGHLLTRKR